MRAANAEMSLADVVGANARALREEHEAATAAAARSLLETVSTAAIYASQARSKARLSPQERFTF